MITATDGDELLHHLLADLVWKGGIIAAIAIISLVAATLIWRTR